MNESLTVTTPDGETLKVKVIEIGVNMVRLAFEGSREGFTILRDDARKTYYDSKQGNATERNEKGTSDLPPLQQQISKHRAGQSSL